MGDHGGSRGGNGYDEDGNEEKNKGGDKDENFGIKAATKDETEKVISIGV